MGSEGQIQSELMTQMRSKIQSALVAERVEVTDVQGDGRHVEIVVISKDFEGKTSVNRQRMVYKVKALFVYVGGGESAVSGSYTAQRFSYFVYFTL